MSALTDQMRGVADEFGRSDLYVGNIRQMQLLADQAQPILAAGSARTTALGGTPDDLDAIVAALPIFATLTGNLPMQLLADGSTVVAAADWIDTTEGTLPPVLVASTVAIGKAVDPLVMTPPPLDPRIVAAADVWITGSGWPSIDDQWWPIQIVAPNVGQFSLTGADTSGETVGNGAGASIFVRV